MDKGSLIPSWVTLQCEKTEELVIGRSFKTAGLAGDPDWDVMIDVAICVNKQGKTTGWQTKGE